MAAGSGVQGTLITTGKPSLADECEAILNMIGDDAVTIASISEETGIPSSRVADILSGPLSGSISRSVDRVMGVKLTLYSRKEA